MLQLCGFIVTLNCFCLVQEEEKVPILTTFYEQISFSTSVFALLFFYKQFGIVIFWQKDISAKAAYKKWVKLNKGVKFTNILQVAFLTISFD